MQPLKYETQISEKHPSQNQHHQKSQEKPKDLFILQNKLIFKKYQPIKQIGRGTFSTVYLALNINTNKYVAIKAEKRSNNTIELLKTEAFLLYSLKGYGIPEVLSYGKTKNHNILVMPLLGKSLLDMFIIRPCPININDICFSSLQILDRIEWVHANNIVYRDIKPENFLFGKTDANVLYLIDFGLCRKYKSQKTGKHITPKNLGKFTGTSRYASVYAMGGNEQSRRDDIESIGYMIIYFMKKKLPWQGIKGNSYKECYHKLYLMKKHMDLEILCRGLPREVFDYMKYAKSLKFEQEPNYIYLKKLFQNILTKKNIIIDKYILSWCKNSDNVLNNEKNDAVNDNKNNINKKNSIIKLERKSSPHNRISKQIKENLEEKNKNSSLNYSNINSSNNMNQNMKSIQKNEYNSEVSNTLRVFVSKNLQSVNNSGQNESAGINLNLGRINSEKNVYSDNFFLLGMNNNNLRGHSPINYQKLISLNQSLRKNNSNINMDNKFRNNFNYMNNNNTGLNIGNSMRKIISINPVSYNNNTGNINNNIFININNNKPNKITKIRIAGISKENNNNFTNNKINNNNIITNTNTNKENIIYSIYNTYNTYNNINTPINNNNNPQINNIYKRDTSQLINYQNFNDNREKNKKNCTSLNYLKSGVSIENNNNNNYNHNKSQIQGKFSSIDITHKKDSIMEHFFYNKYQNNNNNIKKELNSSNNIRKNKSLNKKEMSSVTPILSYNNNYNQNSKNILNNINSYNYKKNNYNIDTPKNNFLKITKHNNSKNTNNRSINKNYNMMMNLNKSSKSFTNVNANSNMNPISKTKNNKTLDVNSNSYYFNNNNISISKSKTELNSISLRKNNNIYYNKINSVQNKNNINNMLYNDNKNKKSSTIIFNKIEPKILPNHSLRIIKTSLVKNKMNNENKENNLSKNNISFINNGNRINKYKIVRNRNTYNH